jgi:hypothetical protein
MTPQQASSWPGKRQLGCLGLSVPVGCQKTAVTCWLSWEVGISSGEGGMNIPELLETGFSVMSILGFLRQIIRILPLSSFASRKKE